MIDKVKRRGIPSRAPSRGAWQAAVLLSLLVVAVAAWGARRPSYGGSARVPTDSPVHSLDPLDARWPAETLLVSALYDSPYFLEWTGRPRPHLLLPIQGEGKTLRFKARPHAVFHDGTSVGAKQVFESLQRLARSRDYGWLLAMVEGTAPGMSSPSGLKLVGGQTIEIRMSSARSVDLLVLALAAPQAGIVPSSRKAHNGVGSGPFALRSRRGGDHTLRSNRDYFDGPPFLNDVTLLRTTSRDDHIRRFQLGRADGSLLGDSVYGEPPIKGIVLNEGPLSDVEYLIFNTSRDPGRNQKLRQAVHLALDRRRLAAGAAQPVGFPGDKRLPRFDPARARALLAKAGSTVSGGRSLVLLVEEGDALGVSLAPMIERDLITAGLSVELVKAPSSEYRSRLTAGNWDMRLQSLSPVSPEPVLQLAQLLALGGLREQAFRLVRRAPTARGEESARALSELNTKLRVLPLCQRRQRLHHRLRLRGVSYTLLGGLRLADMWIRPATPSTRRGR